MVYVAKFEKISKDDIDIAGGKGANLGELTQAGIPVPPGFVITSETYEKFMNDTEINTTIMDILDNVDVNDTKALQEAADEIKSIIVNTPMPMDIKTLIIEAYNQLSESVGEEEADVAVRSSATAEDLPDASFAGQQDTYLHVKGVDEVVEYVQKVWASLFEARAIFYREENNFDHDKVYIAVCVQQMVQAEKSGVMFTVNPSTGEQVAMIESSWGLGEAVVSGDVTPDHYDVNKANNKIENLIVSDKKYMYTNDENGTSIRVNVPEEKRNERVLSDEDLNNLVEMGKTIENHYGQPMDTEWAIEKGRLYLLQARPITTLDNNIEKSDSTADLDVIIKGLGASPGMASGSVKIILDLDELDKIEDGDIMVTTMTTPDMVPAMRKSSGIITDEGGVTCHASIISRELGIPCVVGTGEATNVLNDKQEVTIDGKKGLVYEGLLEAEEEASSNVSNQTVQNVTAPIITVTDVKVNVSMPEAAKRAAATGADGVGLLRAEHMMLGLGVHPKKFITDGKEDELVDKLVNDIVKVADEFYPKPVWYRTMDAPTDEFVTLEGGENEPVEHNPMLGWRGIRRELDEPEIIKCEFKAIKKLHEKGYTNLGIMLPLAQRVSELSKAKELCAEVGLIPQKDVAFGMMVETPAAA